MRQTRYDPDTVYALEDESMEESGTSYTTRAPVQKGRECARKYALETESISSIQIISQKTSAGKVRLSPPPILLLRHHPSSNHHPPAQTPSLPSPPPHPSLLTCPEKNPGFRRVEEPLCYCTRSPVPPERMVVSSLPCSCIILASSHPSARIDRIAFPTRHVPIPFPLKSESTANIAMYPR
eukprot:768036-Hanusia_phi.AAC.5